MDSYCRGQDDLSSLRLSQRSNALAFSQHYFFSSSYGAAPSTRAAKKLNTSAIAPRIKDPRVEPHASHKKANQQVVVVGENSDNVIKHRKVASLIPPSVRQSPITKDETKAFPAAGSFRRPRSSAASIRSFSSSSGSRKRKITPVSSLDTLPSEIQDQIFADLPQRTLHDLTLTSTAFVEAAAAALYSSPKFATTYRFAQFVTTVVHSRRFAEMVRNFSLADFGQSGGENVPVAGWREWKYRTEPLYSIPRPGDLNTEPTNTMNERRLTHVNLDSYRSHPRSSPFLKQYSMSQDVPVGAIIHVLKACPRIKYEAYMLYDLSTECL